MKSNDCQITIDIDDDDANDGLDFDSDNEDDGKSQLASHKYETTHQICPLCSRKVDPVFSPINLKPIYLEAMFDPKLSPKLSPQTQFPSPF